MRWLWRWLCRRFARRQAPPVQTVQDYVQMVRDHPGTRITTVRLLGGQARADNVLFGREHLEFEDDDGNARQVDVFDARVCSFGHVLDQTVRATAVCRFCGALMCSSAEHTGSSCAAWCSVCLRACCARHRSLRRLGHGQTVVYCHRCLPLYYWRLFWGLNG